MDKRTYRKDIIRAFGDERDAADRSPSASGEPDDQLTQHKRSSSEGVSSSQKPEQSCSHWGSKSQSWPKDNSDYNLDQISCITEVQLQSGNMKMLSSFLSRYAERPDIINGDMYKRAMAWLAFNHGHHSEVYNILETHPFGSTHHGELQDLWYQARYAEAEKARCRMLGAVDESPMSYCVQLYNGFPGGSGSPSPSSQNPASISFCGSMPHNISSPTLHPVHMYAATAASSNVNGVDTSMVDHSF
ncbi:hypothetical protein RvY_09290 [Ramazzottius varieornatus]|uniref:Homeobox protein SIX1 N-terminal SD domain-containing protein n=1 Tax=Ramazzottius varieornatus TaxID=947166 RepID=A0A1D1V8Y2_RAMVA|nr:hypothetical protein RvY_09290 [Ramazzottius varieornatus]